MKSIKQSKEITFKILPKDYRFQEKETSVTTPFYFKSLIEENNYLRDERRKQDKQYRKKCEINKRNNEQIKTLTRQVKDHEYQLQKQTEELNQLKECLHHLQSLVDPLQPECISVSIPILNFITGETFQFEHNDYQFSIVPDVSLD